MKIISRHELESVKKQIDFYNFKTSESKHKTIIVKFHDQVEVTTFSDISFGGDIRDFNEQALLIRNMFFNIIDLFTKGEVLITKYETKWLNNDNCLELINFFRKNNLKPDFDGGIKTKNKEIIEIFFDGNIKYCSFLNFVFVDEKIIITPTDHMDIFLHSINPEETLKNIRKIKERIDQDSLLVVEEFKTEVR